jgi:hypothetical protein
MWWDENRIKYLKDCSLAYKNYEDYVSKNINKIEDKYNYLIAENKHKLNAIIRRGINNMNKIILLDSIINEKKITTQNIDFALELFDKCINSVKDLIFEGTGKNLYVEDKDRLDKRELAILKIIKNYGIDNEISLSYLNTLLGELKIMKSPNTKDKWIDRLEEKGFIKKIILGDFNKKSIKIIKNIELDD